MEPLEETAAEPSNVAFTFKEISFTWGELTFLGGCGIVLFIGLVVLLIYLSRRSQEQLMGGAEQFEREVLNQLSAPAAIPSPSQPPPSPSPTSPGRSAQPPSTPPPSDSPVDALVSRLRGMELLGSFQGVQSLGFGPDAHIYALKGGGTVLILPRMESEAFLTNALKTHSMAVAATSDGGALVITPLGQRMSVSVKEEVRHL